MLSAVFLASAFALVAAQDPAGGWLGYARALPPSGKPGQRLTFISAKWKNLKNPRPSQSFYSPWFGIDTADNLNLLQPVNPWLGNEWVAYNEYYQWQPSHNENSAQHNVNPGEEHYGSITYEPSTHSYTIFHNISSGWSVSTPIKIQKDSQGREKNYSIGYFVFEKDAPCGDYPPDEVVTFTDIQIQWDNVNSPAVWSTGIVDDVCEMRAHIINPSTSGGSVNITWNTKAADPPTEWIQQSQSNKVFGVVPPSLRFN